MLNPEALVAAVTAAAISIAEGKSTDDVALLGVVFTQLGDTLSTLSTARQALDK